MFLLLKSLMVAAGMIPVLSMASLDGNLVLLLSFVTIQSYVRPTKILILYCQNSQHTGQIYNHYRCTISETSQRQISLNSCRVGVGIGTIMWLIVSIFYVHTPSRPCWQILEVGFEEWPKSTCF